MFQFGQCPNRAGIFCNGASLTWLEFLKITLVSWLKCWLMLINADFRWLGEFWQENIQISWRKLYDWCWNSYFESGQMGLKWVKWPYSGVYLSQRMWNHAQNSMKKIKRSISVFSLCAVESSLLKSPIFDENSRNENALFSIRPNQIVQIFDASK